VNPTSPHSAEALLSGVVEPIGLGPVWLDWLMILALAWSASPSVFLRRTKLRWLLSPELVSTTYAPPSMASLTR
jgi:hypothetical protein